MRSFFLVITFALLCFGSTDLFAQSGSRSSGSSSRGRSSGSGARQTLPQGRPSRTGAARSSRPAPQAMPSGILNSARHATSSRRPTTGGSSSRPSLPYRPSPSARGGSSPSLSAGSSTKRRTPRSPKSYASTKTSTSTGGSSTKSNSSQSTTTTLVSGSDSFASLKDGSRVWTDASGRFTINGKMAAYQNGTVWIRRDDGLISKLSLIHI